MTDQIAPELVQWPKDKKWDHMEGWAQNLMRDPDLSKAAVKVAWALAFAFNRDTGQCWQTIPTIARTINLSGSYVTDALKELEQGGYIIRRREWVEYEQKKLRVFLPARLFDPDRAAAKSAPRKARGGVPKGVNPREIAERKRQAEAAKGCSTSAPIPTDFQLPDPTDVQHPCILEDNPRENPFQVQGVSTGARTVILDDDLDF